jgi:3-oxoacyl-[acyl-carrier protein] reductase
VKKLQGKTALVTGSGRGIGRAIAIKLASEGANVVINDLEEDAAMEVVKVLEDAGGKAVICVGDVTADDFPERYVASALEAFGGIDIIVNNAGYTWDNVLQKMTDEQWDAILDVHVKAPFRILRAASDFIRNTAKAEIEQGGANCRKVVNISSISGLYGNAGQMNYAAAKSALVGMTKTLAKEWGRYNVTANCVAFGLIETRMTKALSEGVDDHIDVAGREIRAGMQPEMIENIKRMTPLGRTGSTEDAANAVYLMCCPESDFITGQVIEASGGLAF